MKVWNDTTTCKLLIVLLIGLFGHVVNCLEENDAQEHGGMTISSNGGDDTVERHLSASVRCVRSVRRDIKR